jgi:sigma-B regulation protein RsbU (phosphoserine phosphatase)
VTVGDVSGKGIAAALLMARTLGMLRAELMARGHLAEAMTRLNAALCVNNERCVFVTVYAAVIDLATGELSYVDAGHLPAVAYSSQGVRLIDGGGHGPCLGIMEDAVYQAEHLRLAPGDGLLLYTDGLTDATDGAGERFRLQRVLDALADAAPATAAAAAATVLGAVTAHVGEAPPADDLTVLAVTYRGPD